MRYLHLLFALLCCITLHAQVFVGYCPETIAGKGLGNANLTATISCASAFTNDGLLQPYQHCGVGSVRVGLSATEGVSSLKVWVREHLAGENIVEAEAEVDCLVVGWNDIALPDVVGVEGHDTLYVGYDYTQSQKSVPAISYAGKKNTPLSFYIGVNGRWNNYTSKYGPVSICAGIVGMADHVVRLNEVVLDRRSQPYCADYTQHQPVVLEGTVQNLGTQPLHSFRLQCSDNSAAPTSACITLDEDVAFGECAAFSYSVMPGQTLEGPASDIALQLAIACPNEDADAVIIDGVRTLYYDLFDDSQLGQPAVNIIEEFTSERCGFAPVGQQRLREAVEQLANDDTNGFVIMSHHEGFGQADAWRVTNATDYDARLFGPDALTFAPAAMVNRSSVPFSTTLPVDSLVTLLEASPIRSYAALEVDVTLAGSTVSAQVGVLPCALTFCHNPQLVLCLVQPEVASVAQKNYYPQDYSDAVQRDVVRCYLHNSTGNDALLPQANMDAVMSGNARIGDYLEISADGKLWFEYSGTLPSDISQLQGLTLVAYIYDKGYTNQMFATYSKKL